MKNVWSSHSHDNIQSPKAGGILGTFLLYVRFIECYTTIRSHHNTHATKPMKHTRHTIDCISEDSATLAGGCFWCLESIYDNIHGVLQVTSGYTGGSTINPTYQEICTGTTNHAECIQISFLPHQVSYQTLLEIFFAYHDPTTLNSQGPDFGTQYRSEIFYLNEQQKQIAEKITNEENIRFSGKIVTKISLIKNYCPAEEYHQKYLEKR